MGSMTPQPENHPDTIESSCDALTRHAPRALSALQAFVQRSLPLLPTGVSLASLTRVLDVGCGQHLWGRDLFRAMLEQAGPELVADVRIEGVDRCSQVVQTARQTFRTGRNQVFITYGDLLHLPAEYQERYQLVQMRFLLLSLPPPDWRDALAQMRHACAPGGTVVWLEPSLPTPCANTPGWNLWLRWIIQSIAAHGGSPSIDRAMSSLFAVTGHWEHPHYEVISVPLLHASHGQGSLLMERIQVVRSWLEELRPWLVEGGIPVKEVNLCLKVVLKEINHREVQSVWPWTLVAGTKPSAPIPRKRGREEKSK